MQQEEQRRVFRPMQTAAPFPNGTGHYHPINSQFNAVKPMQDTAQCMKRPPQDLALAVKKSRTEAPQRSSSQAADELLGKSCKPPRIPAIAAKPNDGVSNINTDQQRGPTDFKCFTVSAKQPLDAANTTASSSGDYSTTATQHQQQPSAQPQAHQVQASLTTFADLAALPAATSETDPMALNIRKQSLLSFRMPAPMDRKRSVGCALPTQAPSSVTDIDAAGTRQLPQQPEIVVHHCLPYDWALKSSVRFTCNSRFAVYDSYIMSSAKHAGQALHHHTWHHMTPQERLHVALTSWRHPAACWATDTLAALQQGAVCLLEQRLDAWRVAFSSAYMAVRHRQAPALYLDSPKGSRHHCTILFIAAGARGTTEPQALMSTSTAQQRTRMLAAGLQILMPLAPTNLTTLPTTKPSDNLNDKSNNPNNLVTQGKLSDEDEVQLMLREAGQTNASVTMSTPAISVRDGSPQSLLLFQGHVAVHMLFDYLLQEVSFTMQQGADLLDLPLMLLPKPFEGASPWQPEIKSMHGTGNGNEQPRQQTSQQPVHVLEMIGPLPPWTLTRVCAALVDQPLDVSLSDIPKPVHSVSVDMTTQPHSLALNVWLNNSSGSIANHNLDMATEDRNSSTQPECWQFVPHELTSCCAPLKALCQRVIHGAAVHPDCSHQQAQAAGPADLAAQATAYKLKLSG